MALALAKTLAGRHALRDRSQALNMRERQLLVMCDGKRTAQELAGFVGDGAQESVVRLMELGFVAHVDETTVRSKKANLTQTGTYSVRDGEIQERDRAASSLEWPPSQHDDFSDSHVIESNTSGSVAVAEGKKRSLAGAKMYLINILQIVRHLEANLIVKQLHDSKDRRELVKNILGALTFLQETSGEEYAERIFDQLHDMLPEKYLPMLHQHSALPTQPARLDLDVV